MQDSAPTLHEQLIHARPRHRNRGWPEELRRRVAIHAAQRHDEGESWRAIGDSLGLDRTTVRAWVRALGEAPTMNELVPVVVTPSPHPVPGVEGLVLVSPRGFRIEGLDIDAAISALERLG